TRTPPAPTVPPPRAPAARGRVALGAAVAPPDRRAGRRRPSSQHRKRAPLPHLWGRGRGWAPAPATRCPRHTALPDAAPAAPASRHDRAKSTVSTMAEHATTVIQPGTKVRIRPVSWRPRPHSVDPHRTDRYTGQRLATAPHPTRK